ncbi:MAG: DUF1109 domain-containing protein [Acidobacteriia bacterium]|nr:DUF1109 domain-containing protein [Terriglobia bacterium]
MTEKELDAILKQAAAEPHEVDRAVVERVSGIVLPSLQPVRPLPPVWVIAVVLQLIFVAVAILGATLRGLNGIRVLNSAQSSLIFWVLGSLGLMAASASAAGMAPGSKSWFDARILLATCTAAFVAVFAVMFHDYRMDRFLTEGIACLGIGLLHAVAAGLLLWLVLRRGMILNPMSVGVAAGTLAGLAGFGMLELHCPILKAMHLMVWHIAVIPLSGLAGYLVGRLVRTWE